MNHQAEAVAAGAASAAREGNLLWQTLLAFLGDGCPRMAAALSYYLVFSLPPLLVLLMLVAGVFVDPQTARELLEGQVGGLLGPDGAAQVETMIGEVARPGLEVSAAAALGIAALLLGATAAFAQLQDALNAAWQVEPDPARGDVKNFLLKRVLSFAMILAINFLLLVSLVVSALLAAFTGALNRLAPAGLSGPLLQAVNTGVSLAVIALLFALMFKTLPDAVVRWRDAAVGGFATALLFTVGKFLIGYYLGSSNPGSAYGAAGSLAVVLLWIYYSSMILLFGAEFTRLWAERHGTPIQPDPGAVRVIRTKQRIDPVPKQGRA